MRFLHTADWHVGKPLRGRSRLDEYASALDQVGRIAVEERVDAVLVAGDVFDSPAPPPEAEKLVYDFLARLLAERIACIVIAGNHDHPRRLGALAQLLEGLRIHVRAEVRPPSQGGIVSLASRDGSEEACVAVLPFVPERRVFDACQVMGPEHEWYEAYAARIEQILGFLARSFTPRTVNLIVGHLLISGARVGTGERPLHLGRIYGVNAEQLPANAQYVALGHLHRPQEIQAPSRAFYAGSLIELDFGEREQEKRVIVVDVHPGRAADARSVPLRALRRLRDVAGTLDDLRALRDSAGDDFLRVRVRVAAPAPGIAEQVRAMLPNALDVQLDYARQEPGKEAPRLKKLGPAELFAQFHQARHGAPPSEAMLGLFERLHEQASHAEPFES